MTDLPSSAALCVPAVTYVVSSDPLLLSEEQKALVARALDNGPEAFNLTVLDAAEHGLEAVLDACEPLPVMAPRRVVLCKRAHKIPAASAPLLLAYIAKPNLTTALILVAERLDLRTKLATALTRAKAVVRKEPPRPQAMARWAQLRAQTADFTLRAQAADALIDRVGPEPTAVAQALEKLQAMAGADHELSLELVQEGIAFGQAAQIFALCNALYVLDFAELVALFNRLLIEGQSPLGMLGLIARELRLLIGAAAFEGSTFALANHLGVRDFIAERLAGRARHKSIALLVSDLDAVGRVDAELKQSALPAHLIFSRLARRLAGAPSGRTRA